MGAVQIVKGAGRLVQQVFLNSVGNSDTNAQILPNKGCREDG